MITFKKLKDGTFEKTESKTQKTILDKKELEKGKEFLEGQMADLQSQLDSINENLEGIKKAK